MKTFAFKTLVLFALSLSIFAASAFEARVVGVSDGDTITVLDAQKTQFKIRVAGIDAPEKSQDFGHRSKEHLSDLVYGRTVNLPDKKIDKYGRTVSRVLVGNTDAGLDQIKAGMAWHYKKYQREQSAEDRADYSAAETRAKETKLGMWVQGNAIRPEDFRSASMAPKETGSDTECPCGTNQFCTGSRGGQFCMDGVGYKKYLKR